MVNTILAKRVNHIVAKGDNPAWPKGLDISDLSKLLMIRCSNQTSDGAAMQTLTLTLAAAPRAQSVEHHSRVHGRRTLPVDAVICFEHLRFGVPIG